MSRNPLERLQSLRITFSHYIRKLAYTLKIETKTIKDREVVFKLQFQPHFLKNSRRSSSLWLEALPGPPTLGPPNSLALLPMKGGPGEGGLRGRRAWMGRAGQTRSLQIQHNLCPGSAFCSLIMPDIEDKN